jgi:hypothetical protein
MLTDHLECPLTIECYSQGDGMTWGPSVLHATLARFPSYAHVEHFHSNMWYARGEWELCLDCFRRSLFWNHAHTSTLLNLAGVMVKLGFERDARSVMEYYDVIQGGTMGGWKPDKENAIRSAIDRGLKLAESPRNGGRTRGEIQLFGPVNPMYMQVDPTANATHSVTSDATTASNSSASFSAQSHIRNQGLQAFSSPPHSLFMLAFIRQSWCGRVARV